MLKYSLNIVQQRVERHMEKKYIVRLTLNERQALEDLVRKGRAAAYRLSRIMTDANRYSTSESDERYRCHINYYKHSYCVQAKHSH